MGEYERAMSSGDYARALKRLKDGLRLTSDALREMAATPIGLPRVPFVEARAGAVAALFDDRECFDLMASVAKEALGDRRSDIDRFRLDALLVSRVREQLALENEIELNSLRTRFDRADSARLRRLLSWMEKNQELTIEEGATGLWVSRGPRALAPALTFATFREGQSPTPTEYLEPSRPRHHRRIWTGVSPSRIGTNEAHVEIPLPEGERHVGVMSTRILRSGFWLVGRSRRKANGSYSTQVVVKSHLGETVKTFELKHKAVRVFSSYDRDQVLVVDSVLGVHIFDYLGEEAPGFSLASTPEYESIYREMGGGIEKIAFARCVDVHPRTGEIVYSAIDHIWRFTGQGLPVSAQHFTEPGLIRRAEGASISTAIELAWEVPREMNSGRDWVYFVKFSMFDDSIFVSLYSGRLMRIDRAGQVIDTWDLPAYALDLIEEADVTLVTTFESVSILKAGGKLATHPSISNEFLKPAFAIGRSGRVVTICATKSGSVAHYDLRHDIRALYPLNGRLRVDMTTTFAELSLTMDGPAGLE